MKIGYYGDDDSTLMTAVIQQSLKGNVNALSLHFVYDTYDLREELLKDKSMLATVVDCLRRGATIDLGCDPCMTKAGRELSEITDNAQWEFQNKGNDESKIV